MVVELNLGAGIAIGTLVVSIAAVWISAIKAKQETAEVCSIDNKTVCLEHSGVIKGIRSIEDCLDRHDQSLETISRDVKILLQR